MNEVIPKHISNELRQTLLYLKQIDAIDYQKTGATPTRNFQISFAKMLTMLVADRGDLSKETLMDATVLTVTAMSKLSGEVGISADMLLNASLVMMEFSNTWFKELKTEIRKLKKEILKTQLKKDKTT
jgi:hypothetical protein